MVSRRVGHRPPCSVCRCSIGCCEERGVIEIYTYLLYIFGLPPPLYIVINIKVVLCGGGGGAGIPVSRSHIDVIAGTLYTGVQSQKAVSELIQHFGFAEQYKTDTHFPNSRSTLGQNFGPRPNFAPPLVLCILLTLRVLEYTIYISCTLRLCIATAIHSFKSLQIAWICEIQVPQNIIVSRFETYMYFTFNSSLHKC